LSYGNLSKWTEQENKCIDNLWFWNQIFVSYDNFKILRKSMRIILGLGYKVSLKFWETSLFHIITLGGNRKREVLPQWQEKCNS